MQPFKQLYLYPITGLYKECFDVDYSTLVSPPRIVPDNKHCLRYLNNKWWHQALSKQTLEKIVDSLENRYLHSEPESIQHRAILANPNKFIEAVVQAPRVLANIGEGARGYFSALETLQIFCTVYSDTISYPHALSLQEGLVLNELSSFVMAKEALNTVTNPYLPFLQENVWPVITTIEPNLIWISGRIRMSTFAMAMYAKQLFPSSHISVVGHSSEYYSLNKITKYLKQNDVLFSVIDSIVLGDPENTVPQLVECIQHQQPLDSVPNLLYASGKDGRNIVQESTKATRYGTLSNGSIPLPSLTINDTPLMISHKSHEFNTYYHPVSIPTNSRAEHAVDPSEIVDVKLWPNAKCYWDQCNFCAINRKYITLPKNSFRHAEQVADYMISVSEQKGIKYFWSMDEAIPPDVLGELATHLIEKGANIIWETRSKIDGRFTQEICDALGKSGLREIRLGLESASPRVLAQMGKHPVGWSLEMIENVVRYFHNSGVSVHFPTIIGFPTETKTERLETYAFLEYLIGKYPSVTFNMNVLGFDVASKLYENYESHGITSIHWPAPSKYFLGNLLDWDCQEVPFEYERLDYERNELMRRLLYPWIPETAMIPEYIFYRLAETSRATMLWKQERYERGEWRDCLDDFDFEAQLIASSSLVTKQLPKRSQYDNMTKFFVYDWKTHHTFECDEIGMELLKLLKSPSKVHEVVRHFSIIGDETEENEVVARLQDLLWMGVLSKAHDLCNEVQHEPVFVASPTLSR